MARHARLEEEEHDRQPEQDHAGDVERQGPRSDEREDQREAADDARHEVRVHQFEQQAVEADREQDEGDVRVRQQVQELLERVHALFADRRAGRVEGRRRPVDRDLAPVGECEHVGDGRGDPVDRADSDGLRSRATIWPTRRC